MKRALSLLDDSDLDAAEFSQKDPDWISSRRRKLVCLACGAPAFFRAASATRKPSFGATHEDRCLLTAPPWSAFRFFQ
jgi:hypothetical protein